MLIKSDLILVDSVWGGLDEVRVGSAACDDSKPDIMYRYVPLALGPRPLALGLRLDEKRCGVSMCHRCTSAPGSEMIIPHFSRYV